MARGLRGVKDDLTEIGRHLLDIACFLSPLIANTYADSPPSSPHPPNPKSPPPTPTSAAASSSRVIAGAISDLSEIGGGFRSGILRLSSVLRRPAAGKERDLGGGRGGGVELSGLREEVLGFVRDLVKCPESWVEFPVPFDDDFDMSLDQKEHIATVERLVPSLAALRISLCPSFMNDERFWKIYFALLHPKLNKHETEFLSTQQIVEEMRINLKKKMDNRINPDSQIPVAESSSSMSIKASDIQQEYRISYEEIQQEEIEVHHVPLPSTETTSLQYIDRWFERPAAPRERDASMYNNRPQTSNKDESEAEDDNIALLKKYASSSSIEAASLVNSPFSSYERLHLLEKSYSKDYHGKSLQRLQSEETTDAESSGWHAVEDSSDFEIVERS